MDVTLSMPVTFMTLFQRARSDAAVVLRQKRLIAGIVLAGTLWFVFFAVVQDLIANDPLVRSDLRTTAFLETFRSPGMNRIMLLFTDLGNWQVITAGSVAFGVVLLYSRRFWWACALIISMLGEQALSQGLKHLFHRSRPDHASWLVTASGGSFPSGHTLAGATFYGFLACFIVSQCRSWTTRVLILIVAALLVMGIALSRVYLGVHWPSDVIGALVLGPAWLATVFLGLDIGWPTIQATSTVKAARWPMVLASVAWGIVLIAVFALTHPLINQTPASTPPVELAANEFDTQLFMRLPRFTEDLTGAHIEPISVVLAGSEEDVKHALSEGGWLESRPMSVRSGLELVWAQLRNLPDPDAPGAPSFLNGAPNTFSFEKATAQNSVRERHHLHLWRTLIEKDKLPIWVGNVHLDTVGELYGLISYHKIDPDVDKQREQLTSDLQKNTCATDVHKIRVTDPLEGVNLLQSPFFTDGQAAEITVRCVASQ